jgi:hypothetical protein
MPSRCRNPNAMGNGFKLFHLMSIARCASRGLLHTCGESNVAELRRHFQKSLGEPMDVFHAPC